EVAHHPFNDLALIKDRAGHFVGLYLAGQFRTAFQCSIESDVEVVRNHFGNPVGGSKIQPHGAGDIAYHHFSTEFTEGNDVGNAVLAVLFAHVVDNLATAAHAKVDIE